MSIGSEADAREEGAAHGRLTGVRGPAESGTGSRLVKRTMIRECPPLAAVPGTISESEYLAFASGWFAGIARQHSNPASHETLDEVATMLDMRDPALVIPRERSPSEPP
jgi:hypothetical protein